MLPEHLRTPKKPDRWTQLRWLHSDLGVLHAQLRLAIGAKHNYKVTMLAKSIEKKSQELVQLVEGGTNDSED